MDFLRFKYAIFKPNGQLTAQTRRSSHMSKAGQETDDDGQHRDKEDRSCIASYPDNHKLNIFYLFSVGGESAPNLS